MPVDEGTGGRRVVKPPPKRKPTPKKPPAQAVRFGADVGLFVPPALVKPPRVVNPDRNKVPTSGMPVRRTAQEERLEREEAKTAREARRTRDAIQAPVSLPARLRVRRGETAAERKVRETVLPPRRSIEEIAAGQKPLVDLGAAAKVAERAAVEQVERVARHFQARPGGYKPGATGIGAIDAVERLGRATAATGKGLNRQATRLATAGVEPLEDKIGPVVDIINRGLAAFQATRQGGLPGGLQESAVDTAGIVPPEVAQNFATGLATTIAGAPAGMIMLVNEPGKVWRETKRQYADYYGPLLSGDFDAFKRNLETQPVQIVFDVWAALALGAGAGMRAVALKRTLDASPEQLRNISRGAAMAQSILFRKEPYSVAGVGQVFGRRPMIRYEEFKNAAGETARVQRMVPQSAIGTKVSDVLQSVRAVSGGSSRRGEKLVREEFEQRGTRSRAELATFARRINDYDNSLLDQTARLLGVAGTGRKGRTAKVLEANRVEAARALSMAIDRAGIHGGDLPHVIAKIQTEITQRQRRFIEEGSNAGDLQSRRIRDLVLARDLLQHYHDNPQLPDAVRFQSDLAAVRALADDTEQRLVDAGILRPSTAARMIDRQTRDVELIEAPDSPTRAKLEEALFRLWGDEPEQIATALNLMDAAALSFSRRTGVDADEWYADTWGKLTLAEPPPEALLQIANFTYDPPAEVAEKNLRSKLNPRTQGDGYQANKPVRRGGIVIVGKVTPQEWVKRVERFVADVQLRDFYARWYEIFEPLFRETFGPDADVVMRGFAVSQANDSPTGGLSAVLQVMDKVRRGEDVKAGEISLVVEGIASAVKGMPIERGMAAKLRDFSDNLKGLSTRTHMGHDPRGGYPTAIDVHAGRDLGYVDKKMVARLRDMYGLVEGKHYTVETDGKMSGARYERAAEQYQAITDYLNEIGFDGRSDWRPDQVQALGWATAQLLLGKDPETLLYALGRNTRTIDFEITRGPENLGAGLTMESIQAVAREMESGARDLAESTPGIYLRGIDYGVGGWGGLPNPTMHMRVIGSRDAVQELVTKVAQGFRQGLVQASREVTSRVARAAVVIDSPAFADDAVKAQFFARLYEVDPRLEGFMPGEANGNQALIIRTDRAAVSPKAADDFLRRYREAVERVEAEMGIEVGMSARNIELLIGDQYGEAPRSATAGRDRWGAGEVDDPVARAVGERLAAALASAAGGDGPRYTVRVLTRDEAWDSPPQPGFVYHGTTQEAARSIMDQRKIDVGVRSDPPGAWFAESPSLAAFHGDVVLEIPETETMRRLPLGVRVSDEPVMFQWDYPRHYDVEPRGARGGALVRADGTQIFLGESADLTTVVHEGAHAMLPEGLGWLADFDPDWAEAVAEVLEMDAQPGLPGMGSRLDTEIHRRAQEIFAYSVETWAALGRPTATQLRERFAHFRKTSRDVYGGKARIPEEYRLAVDKALDSPSFRAFITELFDPLYGMRAANGAFFISRRTPLARNPLERLRQKTGLAKPRDRVRERTGVLEEQARDVIGPTNVLENAERWQRFFEQQSKLDEIRTSGHAVPVPVNDLGFYDFADPPAGHVVFNPDGLRGWRRYENEALGRKLDTLEAAVSLDDADFPRTPIEISEMIHDAAMDVANTVFPKGFSADPADGTLYYLPEWYRDAFVRDQSGQLLNRLVLGKGMARVADTLKTLNALQRLRMYLALRYVVLNVGATAALNTMHQGLWMPFNLGRAFYMAHAHPDLLARWEAEVGSGFYEALGAGELSAGAPGVAQAIEHAATAVGHFVSRPEAFLRSTSAIHHAHRAGFDTPELQQRLLDAAKEGHSEARAILNQLSRQAEEDVVRFRGFPGAERDMLRAIFFVSGWLISASRFAIRYPANHPFWTTMMAQLGEDGWNEMRERIAEWANQTRYNLEVGEGTTKGGVDYTAQTDLGQWLPFGTANDIANTAFTLFSPEAERRFAENMSAGAKAVYAALTGSSVYGTPYTMSTAADDFLVANTPLDYVADVFPGAFRWLNHDRTPSKLRVDQTIEEYGWEFAFGRAYPNKYVRDEIEQAYAKANADSGNTATRRARKWAQKAEVFHGSPPDEAAVAAKTAMYEWQTEWARERDEAQTEEEKLKLEAHIKVRVMKKYGWIPDDFVYRADSAAQLHAFVETDWENTVMTANEDANDVWSVPQEP